MTEYTDVFKGFVEEGTVFKWTDTSEDLIVTDIKLDEDATVHIYISDEKSGYEDDSITLDDLATKVRNGELRYAIQAHSPP